MNDVEAGRLRIDEAATSADGLKETENDESNSYVPLSPDLERLLRAHIAALQDQAATGWLFPSEVDKPISVNNYLKRNLYPISERAGLGRITLQCLRRTVATHMQHHGAIKSAQGLLRHSNAETTLKHYQETMPVIKREADRLKGT